MEDKNLNAGDQNVENNPSDIENTEKSATESTQEETTQKAETAQPQAETSEPEETQEVKEEAAQEEPAADEKPEEPVAEEVEEPAAEVEVAESTEAEEAKTEESTAEQVEETSAELAEEKVAEVAAASEESGEEVEDDHDENEELPDYTTYTRDQLVETIEELSHLTTFKRSDRILAIINPIFFGMEDERRAMALNKYKEEGGEEDDFEFRHDEFYNRYDASLTLIRDRKSSFYKEREANKTRNLEKKEEILEKLRELIDGENATTHLNPIKKLQEEWKAVGPVPAQHNRTLWANYNALLDRFYNNRHILFELKELDRKKNHKAKIDLCEKAEALDAYENIKDAVIELNELHEEYKRIGAVPREVQEELWQRFKSASDKIYKKRKNYLEGLKGEFEENAAKKRELAKELAPFTNFNSDRINDWNAKTKEILAIQKKWDAIGGVPREQAKEINKLFWSTFKKFFANKNEFFKKLEGLRKENLAKKEALVQKAAELAQSDDLDGTAEKLKQLQRQWRDIGPVPEKFRNSVYAQFKEACDAFFDKKRASQNEAEASYQENLKQKLDIIEEIIKSGKAKEATKEALLEILGRFNEIGFVPRNAIKSTEAKLKEAVEGFVKSLGLSEEEADAVMLQAEFGGQKNAAADKRIGKKESILRRKINEIEDNISLWNNNLAFFANSKTADKLKVEFDEKIAKANEEITQLKKQLKILRNL